jgi:acyl-CoA thioester hydrolase
MAFSLPVRIYWEDTDAGGIVFYANYLKFFERARTEWLRSLGIEQSRLRESAGGIFVVSETAVRYLQPARLDDELIVTAQLQEMGRASLIIAQQARVAPRTANAGRGAAGTPPGATASPVTGAAAPAATLVCEGTIRIGWVEAASLRPARIPSNILEALKP